MGGFFSLDSKFMQAMSRVADLIILNVIYLVTCLPVITIGAASCVNIILFLSMDGWMYYLFFLFVLFLVIVVMMASYAFPLLSQFRNDTKSVLKNALIFSVAYLPRTVLIVVINVLPWALLLTNLYLFLQVGFIWVVVYFAAAAYINTRLLKKVFAPYMEPEEEEK